MAYAFATFIVPNGVAIQLRNLSKMMDLQNTDGMFTVGLSATGIAPITHWISSGMVPAGYWNAMTDPVRLFNIASAAYTANSQAMPYTQLQVTNALGNCDVSTEQPLNALARLGLQIVPPP